MGGQLRIVLGLTITDGKIASIEAVAEPERLRQFDLEILSD
jgi:RNA polymerase sigma-70 factor (ECF subfamily)